MQVLYQYIEINEKTIMFGETEIEKHKFHQHKNPVLIHDVNTVDIKAKSFDTWY